MSDAVERHLEVVRTARYWVLGDAVAYPAEVWFVLHGYQQLARRFLERFDTLADGTRVVVAPEGLSRFYVDQAPGRHGPASPVGATWMTREDRENEIADYVRYLDLLADTLLHGKAPTPRVTVLGFSQGVATAARWTALGRMRPDRLVLWGDWMPSDLDLDAAQRVWVRTEVILVRGDQDPLLTDRGAAAEEATRVRAAGLEVRHIGYEGGHDLDAAALATLAGAVRTPR